MRKIHIAVSTDNIDKTVQDYTLRFGCKPCAIVKDEYALWRTDTLNFSIRKDSTVNSGKLRHLGWEDTDSLEFLKETDVNGIVWEQFTAEQQADEINELWPDTSYRA